MTQKPTSTSSPSVSSSGGTTATAKPAAPPSKPQTPPSKPAPLPTSPPTVVSAQAPRPAPSPSVTSGGTSTSLSSATMPPISPGLGAASIPGAQAARSGPPSASAAAPQPPPPAITPKPLIIPPQRGRGPLPVLVALGFVLLLGGLAYVWQRQEDLIAHPPGVDPVAFANLQSEVRALPRQAPADQRPAPDLKLLDARIAALEGKSGPDLKPLEARIASLEGKPAAQGASAAAPPIDVNGAVAAAIAPLAQQLDAASKSDQASQAALAAKVDAATGRLDAASGQAEDAAKQLAARVDALEKQLAQTAQRADQQAAQAARALRAQQALTALESGKPVGDIPGAPPAAAKFATTNPPTEAELRLSFPAAAARAADASKPGGANLSIGERMLQHAESLVTVRQGDKVVVGGAAAQTLGLAQQKLDVGDLAGAVAALDGLDLSAAQVMAPWRAQAQSLLDARAALTAMTVSASR